MIATFVVPNTELVEQVEFDLTIYSCEPQTLTPIAIPEQFYDVFHETLTFSFEEFIQTPKCTNYLVYELTDVVSQSGQSSQDQSFVTLEPNTRQVSVSTDDLSLTGSYQVQIQANYPLG